MRFEPLADDVVAEVLGARRRDRPRHHRGECVGRRLDRARVLARDDGSAERLQRWRSLPTDLDGTGAKVAELVAALIAGANEPVEVVAGRQAEELERLTSEAKLRGEQGIAGRQAIEDRHKRAAPGAHR